MTPAERIAAEIIRSHYRRLDGSGASYSLADEAIDALMGDADHVHLHRHPDGTITAVPMETFGGDYCTRHHGIRNEDEHDCDFRKHAFDDELDENGEPLPCVLVDAWVDSPGGAA